MCEACKDLYDSKLGMKLVCHNKTRRAKDFLIKRCGAYFKVDGWVLTLDDRKLAPGPCSGILKFKTDHTIDLGLSVDGKLFMGDRAAAEESAPRCWSSAHTGIFAVPARVRPPSGEFAIAEFSLGRTLPSGKRQLTLLRWRADKTFPNTKMTVDSAIKATIENITELCVSDAIVKC